ncbi:hypothetical protein KO465_04740 [Candidatus Micrarchaeota archaeon]|nr:hypothetical protein [Candidatus Micrarchaeota archaeon]
MASTVSNKIKALLAKKAIDFENDSFKIILMASGFAFDEDAHESYADVSTFELSSGNGYTQNDKTLSGVTVTEDDANNRCSVTWDNVVWTASGGAIGPTPGAIIFDDTVTTPTADPIVGYIDFGGEQTQADGGSATIANVEVRLS